jgi:anti-sigma-K factor RskA
MIAESLPGAAARAQISGRRLLWEDANFWRQIAFLSTSLASIACVVALAAVFSMDLGPPQSRLVASLAAGADPAAFVATYDPQRHQMLVVPAALADGAERRVPELWLVTKDKRVVALGIVDAARPHALTIPPALIAETSAGAGLIITLEPQGGAPDGVATGPAIAKGELAPI